MFHHNDTTQARSFIDNHPEYDGRNVVIAILDTGVGLGVSGLMTTSEGKPKIIDVQDCTGSGDVSMKEIRIAQQIQENSQGFSLLGSLGEEENSAESSSKDNEAIYELVGLSGRKIRLGKWAKEKNPDLKFRVGVKDAYTLFPGPLVKRIKADRKAQFDKNQAASLASAKKELENFNATKKDSTKREDLLQKLEITSKIQAIEDLSSNYNDIGPIFDCISFQDEEGMWRAAIDTLCNGDFVEQPPLLTTYRAELQYSKFEDSTELYYAVNFYENGDVLSIVVDSGSHGTHVAGIAAAYFPDQPHLNGVAPGAQIVSFKIGDNRMDSMETGPGMIRAFTACALSGVDIANMSFGEPTKAPDAGRVEQLGRELVFKNGVIFVSSAGNMGPALSTVGAPGSTTPGLFGVGAYIEPSMMIADYSMRESAVIPATNYTWSSRGPTYAGGLGVTISAPGGAITTVPAWTLTKKELKNGTSMASPFAAGCIALILSGLKAKGIPYTHTRIRRAIESTACLIPGTERHAIGHGLIQVADAFEACQIGAGVMHLDLPFEVSLPNRKAHTTSQSAHGIYIREPWEAYSPSEHVVTITPLFETDNDDPKVGFAVPEKFRLEKGDRLNMEIQIEIKSTAPSWIQVPSQLFLNSISRSFKIVVDPNSAPSPGNSLGPNEVAYGEVLGFDVNFRNAGPLFRVPVTVVKPERVTYSIRSLLPNAPLQDNQGQLIPYQSDMGSAYSSIKGQQLAFDPCIEFKNVYFSAGKIIRRFLQIPQGATWYTLTLEQADRFSVPPNGSQISASGNQQDPSASRTFFVHCLQMRPHGSYRQDELEAVIDLRNEPGASSKKSRNAVGGGTLEVCVAQAWSSFGAGNVNIQVAFYGISPSPEELTFSGDNGMVSKVFVTANLRSIRCDPSGTLNRCVQTISPDASKTKMYPLANDTRNALFCAVPVESRLTYNLDLFYTLNQVEKGSVLLRFPLLSDLLYDSPYDSQMVMVFDSNKALMFTLDYSPKEKVLPKGIYTVRISVRHEDPSKLDKLKDMPLTVDRALSGNLKLSFYATLAGVSSGTSKFSPRTLQPGQECVIFVAAPEWKEVVKKLPKGCNPGDVLTGFVRYAKFEGALEEGSDDAVGAEARSGYKIRLVLPYVNAASASANASGDKIQAPKEKSSARSVSPPLPADEAIESALIWAVPLIKARIDLLAKFEDKFKPKEESAFETEFETTSQMIKSTPLKSDDKDKLEYQMSAIKMRRLVKKLRSEIKKAEGGDSKISETGRTTAQSLVDVCAQIIANSAPDEIAAFLGVKHGIDPDGLPISEPDSEEAKKMDQRKEALIEALLFKAHTLLDVISLDWIETDEVPRFEKELEATFEELGRWVDDKNASYVQLMLRRARKHGRTSHALCLLKKLEDLSGLDDSQLSKLASPTSVKELSALKITLLSQLELEYAIVFENNKMIMKYPKEYASI